MKTRLPLYLKVLMVAFLNLCLLAVAMVVIVRAQFRFDPGSFLLAPAQSRIMNVAHEIALDLENAQRDQWDRILSQYSRTNGVALVLFDETAERVAGPDITMPRQVSDMLPRRQRPPRPGDNPQRRPRKGRDKADRPPREDEPRDEPRNDPPPPNETPQPEDRRPQPQNADAAASSSPLFLRATSNPIRYWAGVRIPLRPDRQQNPHPGTLILTSASLLGNQLFFDVTPWITIAIAVILISALCWLPFVRSVNSSIAQMTATAGRIAEGHFEAHASDRRRDEIGQLGEAINRIATHLSTFVNGQRTFLSGIAHELCNPIATIQFGLGNLERRVSEDQRAAVADIQEEVQHMSALVNELLSFTRGGMQAADAKIAAVNVAATVARVLAREATGAPIEVAVDEKLHVFADADYLFRALANVARNALRYAAGGGPIRIAARQENGNVLITVADNGPGVPEEHLEDLFAPFYRLDPARNHETGGLGLGLAIVRSSIEACQGSVRCRNRQPHGLEVEICLPAVSGRSL